MGLAASQARLLTITSRKSDCEYMSMKYSHQKLELAREMSDISNEYQEALNQTELYYDFYGTGDTSNPLTYSLMMTPSALNDYMPTLLTNQQGRVVLDSSYAACARAAGIPQEGLGGTASTAVRNAFVEELYNQGYITESSKNAIQSTTYNNEAGLGSTDVSTLVTTEMTLAELMDELYTSGLSISVYVPTTDQTSHGKCETDNYEKVWLYANNDSDTETDDDRLDENTYADVSLYDLLSGDTVYTVMYKERLDGYDMRINSEDYNVTAAVTLVEAFIEGFTECFSSIFNTDDSSVAAALAYAETQTKSIAQIDDFKNTNQYYDSNNDIDSGETLDDCDECIGWAYYRKKKWHSGTHRYTQQTSLNINNLLYAYLTYYQQYLEGVATSDYYVAQDQALTASTLVDETTVFANIVTEDTISTNDANLAFFYDTLFNQICVNGWTENDEVRDQEYMQQMLKDGMLYISTCSDDGYYYQGNYSTNTMIKEVSDDSGIAQAEAEYTTMKAKLTAKEDELDLKMNNLDTEISSLTTEYDSVKSVIDKNIEKSFTRYDA